MVSRLPPSPFEDSRRIGTVTQVAAGRVTINLPRAATASSRSHHGDHIQHGVVGEFICIPCGSGVILGRITETLLQNSERKTVEPSSVSPPFPSPIGKASLYAFVDLQNTGRPAPVSKLPRLSEFVYSTPPKFLKWIIDGCPAETMATGTARLVLATVPECESEVVSISPKALFERHCAILGSSGGGKSYTIARVLEEAVQFDCKIVVIDPTGEYGSSADTEMRIVVGSPSSGGPDLVEYGLPLDQLDDIDLQEFLSVKEGNQGTILDNAIRSLRLANVIRSTADDRCTRVMSSAGEVSIIIKEGMKESDFDDLFAKFARRISDAGYEFDARALLAQIDAECVAPDKDTEIWKKNGNLLNGCLSLRLNIRSMVRDDSYSLVFACDKKKSILKEIDSFVDDQKKRVLFISLQNVRYGTPCHSVISNSISRQLLRHARNGRFQGRPLLLVVDEAHNFVGTSTESSRSYGPSSCIEVIAKEGRKHKLTLCLATQRPSSLPSGILSQMGTMIVHRLANPEDRSAVDSGAMSAEHPIGDLLPGLGRGEAIIVGADFPVPIPVRIRTPTIRPLFPSPDHDTEWALKVDATHDG